MAGFDRGRLSCHLCRWPFTAWGMGWQLGWRGFFADLGRTSFDLVWRRKP